MWQATIPVGFQFGGPALLNLEKMIKATWLFLMHHHLVWKFSFAISRFIQHPAVVPQHWLLSHSTTYFLIMSRPSKSVLKMSSCHIPKPHIFENFDPAEDYESFQQPIQSLYTLRAVKTGCTFSRSERSSKSRPTTIQYALANTPYHWDSQDQMNVLANLLHISVLANSSICYGQYIKSMCPIYFADFKMGYLGCRPINGFVVADFVHCFGHPNEGSGQWIGMQWQIYACTMANVIEAIWPIWSI